MKWSNVKLIFLREVRDQLRDRRTLFTIAVLPLLLYPVLGIVFLQVAQFLKEHPSRVRVIGTASLPESPPLIEGDRFAASLLTRETADLLELSIEPVLPPDIDPENLREEAQRQIRAGEYDAVVYFPPEFAEKLEASRKRMQRREGNGESGDTTGEKPERETASGEADSNDVASNKGAAAGNKSDRIPQPRVFVDMARDTSRIAGDRVDAVLRSWRDEIVRENLRESRLPVTATQPFQLDSTDVAEEVRLRAAIWSKILPFVVLIWALTGAFYPAVDLCAGEKERGTLETLLSSPARRTEIVWGKLLTVMTFSMATSLLNMASMGATGLLIARQLGQLSESGIVPFGPPPMAAMFWLVLALVPIAALFSALSLAVAAFARSSKEGQYYLMPLLLITLPLIMLPMLPATRLELGTSLIPVTGVMLLLRDLIEGQYLEALRFVVPVVGVTLLCCLLAIRWAVHQFNDESVLFRESERWGLGLWLRHLVRDRGDTPTAHEAILCGFLLLLIRFFAGFVAKSPETWSSFVVLNLIGQVALIATPALLMTIMLTRSPKKTLMLSARRPLAFPAALVLAVALHPLVMLLGSGIEILYPKSEATRQSLDSLMAIVQQAPLWQVLLLMAVLPAICEELAFRGFILSGLRHTGRKWAAIVVSAVFFGVTHVILQQALVTCVVGVVIGYIVIQSGSLLTGMVFHMTHNALFLTAARLVPEQMSDQSPLRWLAYTTGQGEFVYHWPLVVVCGAVAAGLLWWFHRIPYQPYAEETLQAALDHQAARATTR